MGNKFVKAAKLALAMGVALPAAMQVVMPAGVAYAQAITGIIVEGNARVEPETIRAYMQFNAGENVSDAQINASVKALFQTGWDRPVAIEPFRTCIDGTVTAAIGLATIRASEAAL